MMFGPSSHRIASLKSSHFSVGWWSTSPLVLMVSDEATAALRCALKACSRNSSPVLKFLTPLSTEVRRVISRRLHKDPGWLGAPQKIVNTTRRHSQRKWKSPVEVCIFHQRRENFYRFCYILLVLEEDFHWYKF